jgi:hypothetical protein
MELLEHLNWPRSEQEFKCFGVFRAPGELLCAAEGIRKADGSHIFDSILRYLNLPEFDELASVSDVPSARVLTASQRIIEFSASWLTGNKQLDLKLGVTNTRRLGWSQATPPIHGWAWSRILLLLSNERFIETQKEDFTDGEILA